jgi:hypothetical protein
MSYDIIIAWIFEINKENGWLPTAKELMDKFNISESWAIVCLNDYNNMKLKYYLEE